MSRRWRLSGLAAAIGLTLVGAVPAKAIVGASQDGAALAPYAVMVLTRLGSAAGFCSGLVVAPTVILTAAHCVPPGAVLRVHYRDGGGSPVLLDVSAVFRHPDYRPDAIQTRERSVDVALLRLPKPLPQSFRPARLGDHGTTQPGALYRLAGFGLTREGEPTSSGHLRVATVPAGAPLSNLLLWARDPTAGGTGACTGDSGGPVFALRDDVAVALMVWSAGDGAHRCGALTQAIWLGPERTWIDQALKRWGEQPD